MSYGKEGHQYLRKDETEFVCILSQKLQEDLSPRARLRLQLWSGTPPENPTIVMQTISLVQSAHSRKYSPYFSPYQRLTEWTSGPCSFLSLTGLRYFLQSDAAPADEMSVCPPAGIWCLEN